MRGLAVYIAGEDALDQFFCRHPEDFLARPVEAAILDPFNPEIRTGHVLCAAHESPVSSVDAEFLGEDVESVADELAQAGMLPRAGDRVRAQAARRLPRRPRRAAQRVARQFVLLDAQSGEVLGSIEAQRAYSTVHEGAITCTSVAPTSSGSSISARAGPCSSRSTAITSRRPSARS